jgi:hypothetical protein
LVITPPVPAAFVVLEFQICESAGGNASVSRHFPGSLDHPTDLPDFPEVSGWGFGANATVPPPAIGSEICCITELTRESHSPLPIDRLVLDVVNERLTKLDDLEFPLPHLPDGVVFDHRVNRPLGR